MDSLIDRQLGQYKLVQQIGRGTMGTVFKAHQLGLDRWVALKILPPHYADEPEFHRRFLREAQTIARLEHPHILPVYDFGQQDGYTYLVMLYIDDSRTLADVMTRPLSVEQALPYLEQVAAALDHAHRHGVIHRDVKPANILLKDGWVFLADFGLVRMLEGASQLSSTSAGAGTPAYMSPEQGSGGKIDTRTDIYALGVIAYEMLTGQVPHLAENAQALIYRRNHEPAPSLRAIRPDISPAVDQIVQKALAPDPARRFQTAGAFVTALRRAGLAHPTSQAIKTVPRPQPPALPAPAPRPARPPEPPPAKRGPWLWLLVGGLGGFLLIVALIAVLIYASGTVAGQLPGLPANFTPVPTLPATEVLFLDDFSGLGLDRQKWQLVIGSGQLQVNNSELRLGSQGRSFPLVFPAGNPLPSEGNFSIKLTMQHTTAGQQGTGFWLGTPAQPLVGVSLTEEALAEGRVVALWQDENGWRVIFGEEGQELYRLPAPDMEPHELIVNYVNESYQVVLDGRELYVSPPTQTRPATFWLGTPLVTAGNTTWSSLEVDRVIVEALAEAIASGPTSTPVLPLPSATPTEIATSVPPTPIPPTLTPTSVPPTLTPTPASPTQDCAIPVGEIFQEGWLRARQLLGCPTTEAKVIPTIAEEAFEAGHTFWRSDTDRVYIVYDRTRKEGKELFEGRWQPAELEWKWDGSDPDGIGLSPPPGRVEPKRGFGWLWRTHLGGPEGPLGWALDREYGFDNVGQVQRFEQGFMFKGSSSKIYVLLDNGKFYAARP